MVDGYLLYVNWRNNHNHVFVCAQALSKRDASAATRQIQEDDTNLVVPSTSGTTWHVDAVLSRCPCPVGVSGARCKHQMAVLQTFDVPASGTPELRKLYYEIAGGKILFVSLGRVCVFVHACLWWVGDASVAW